MLHRRKFLAGTAVLPLLSSRALAARMCTPPNAFGIRTCSVGVNIGNLETARQQKDHWCWAASISAIFSMHGHSVDQKKIVDKIFPNGDNEAAIGPQIIAAIDGTWTDDGGSDFTANGTVLIDSQFGLKSPYATQIAAQQLDAGNGLIIGSEGHACVLSEMTYALNIYNGAYQLLEMTVRDPWPGNPNKRIYKRDEATLVQFLCAVTVIDV